MGKRATILVLAAVLSVDSADRAMVGVVAPTLKEVFSIGNTQIGLLAAAFSIVGTIATIPVGVLADRFNRIRILASSVAIWSATMLVAGAATSYAMLFLSRMFLGVAVATDGPVIASLTGDMFPVEERGHTLGLIQMGQLVGTLLGFVLTGVIVDVFSWRWAFWFFAVPGFLLIGTTLRLNEPERGAQEVLARSDAERLTEVDELTTAVVTRRHIEPIPELILVGDQSSLSVREVVRYLLRIRTNTILIVANSIGNFFLAGIQTFAVVFFVDQYGLSEAGAAGATSVLAIGAVGGILFGGWFGDRLLRRGNPNGRILVGAWGFMLSALFLFPAFAMHTLLGAVPLFILGGAAIVAPNPSLDAARLDIVHPQLWGRAESFRTVVRAAGEAAAPALFGYMADHVAGGGADGLRTTILLLVPALFLNGAILLLALPSYPREVASVLASVSPPPSPEDPVP